MHLFRLPVVQDELSLQSNPLRYTRKGHNHRQAALGVRCPCSLGKLARDTQSRKNHVWPTTCDGHNRLGRITKDVKNILGCIATQQKKATSPPLILNKHCPECEFRSRCRPLAVEKDDLSLLSHFSGKERKRHNDNGIFTVTQLSYTFRPRRRSGSTVIKFQHALRALAIRKKQIHVVGTPALTTFGTSVYLDVEGDSDRDFYYLIGLRICSSGSCVHHSFWANDVSEESDMWASCLNTLSSIDAPRLIHYGSYETRLRRR